MQRFVSSLFFAGLAAACSSSPETATSSSEALGQKPDCSTVRCAAPECGEGQHAVVPGNQCCAQCVGRPNRCAAVLCPLILCAEGYSYVTSPGDCCGRCAPLPPVAECVTDQDCPQIVCIRCPCAVSFCRGRKCVTTTPDESTCGAQ